MQVQALTFPPCFGCATHRERSPWAMSCSFCWGPCLLESSDSYLQQHHLGSALAPPEAPIEKNHIKVEYLCHIFPKLFKHNATWQAYWGRKASNKHLKNKGVSEKSSIFWVPKQKVQESLHHPGAVGFTRVHSGCHHHSLFGPALQPADHPGCYRQYIHSIPSKAVAQNPHFAVWRDCWVRGNAPKVALQVWISVRVAVGQVADVWVIRELEGPGEWVQGGNITVIVFLWVL